MTNQLSDDNLISLGRLPEGQYVYYLTIFNPFKKDFEIHAEFTGASHDTFIIKDSLEKKNIHLIFYSQTAKETEIRLRLTKGKSVFVKSAACPQIQTDEQKSLSALLAPGILNSFFVQEQRRRDAITDSLRPIDIYARVFKEVQLYNETAINNGFLKPGDMFHDFIDVDTSRKQLDYVVFNKMFAEKKGNFFSKAKRKILRRIFVAVYRILTRNQERKNYIAKLYRNYINMNYLSERKKT